jgi:hypothetical protein
MFHLSSFKPKKLSLVEKVLNPCDPEYMARNLPPMYRPPDQIRIQCRICHVSHRLEVDQAVMIGIITSDAPGLYLRLEQPSMMPLAWPTYQTGQLVS